MELPCSCVNEHEYSRTQAKELNYVCPCGKPIVCKPQPGADVLAVKVPKLKSKGGEKERRDGKKKGKASNVKESGAREDTDDEEERGDADELREFEEVDEG